MAKKVLHVIQGVDKKLGGLPTALFGILGIEKTLNVVSEVLSINIQGSHFDPQEFTQKFNLFKPSFPARFYNSDNAISWLKVHIKEFDLIVFHGVWTLLFYRSVKIAIKNKIDYYMWPHGSLDPFDLQKKAALKKVIGKVFMYNILVGAKNIFCTSQVEKDLLCFFGEKGNNVKVLPLPVDYTDGLNGRAEEFRLKYNIKNNQFVFLFLSRINYKKGLDTLVEVLDEITSSDNEIRKKIKLVIAGDIVENPYADFIKDLISTKSNLTENVIFAGMLTGAEKANAYAGSDIFILPSRNENFGLAIIEALQSGLPVIISKNVYIYDQLFNDDIQHPGWVCESDLSDLKDIVLKAIADKETIKKASLKAGNQYITNNLLQSYSKAYLK